LYKKKEKKMQTNEDKNPQPKLQSDSPKETSDTSIPQKEEAKSLIRKIDERVKTKVKKRKILYIYNIKLIRT
jgi:hypothetical protein